MKKYSFSLWNVFESTSKEVVGFQTRVKALFISLAGVTYVATSAKLTIAVLVIGFVVNELVGCIKVQIR